MEFSDIPTVSVEDVGCLSAFYLIIRPNALVFLSLIWSPAYHVNVILDLHSHVKEAEFAKVSEWS